MLFPIRTAARIIFSFFFSLLHLSFHPQAKVVHPIDRIGRSSRGSSSILADILSLQFSNSQEFDAQTVLERSEFRERHPSNSLQPGRSIARRTTKARTRIAPSALCWSLDRSSFESVTEKRILVEIGPARHRDRGTGADVSATNFAISSSAAFLRTFSRAWTGNMKIFTNLLLPPILLLRVARFNLISETGETRR